GWGKAEQRAVYQPFNLSILAWALIAQAQQGFITAEVGRLTLICLPGTILGVWLGVKAYSHVDDRQFRLIVLWLLLASGGMLTATNLF
ncbi:MAG: TSUP family transporter, partial [Alphaproteobacteria bacterium]